MDEQREIDSRSVGIDITADKLDADGASHCYLLQYMQDSGNLATQIINFQRGPIRNAGNNGVTHEALIAVLIDRLECYQQSQFKCEQNELAMQHLQHALTALEIRTNSRIKRGVEGTNEL